MTIKSFTTLPDLYDYFCVELDACAESFYRNDGELCVKIIFDEDFEDEIIPIRVSTDGKYYLRVPDSEKFKKNDGNLETIVDNDLREIVGWTTEGNVTSLCFSDDE